MFSWVYELYDSNALNTDTKYSETGDIYNVYLASSILQKWCMGLQVNAT